MLLTSKFYITSNLRLAVLITAILAIGVGGPLLWGSMFGVASDFSTGAIVLTFVLNIIAGLFAHRYFIVMDFGPKYAFLGAILYTFSGMAILSTDTSLDISLVAVPWLLYACEDLMWRWNHSRSVAPCLLGIIFGLMVPAIPGRGQGLALAILLYLGFRAHRIGGWRLVKALIWRFLLAAVIGLAGGVLLNRLLWSTYPKILSTWYFMDTPVRTYIAPADKPTEIVNWLMYLGQHLFYLFEPRTTTKVCTFMPLQWLGNSLYISVFGGAMAIGFIARNPRRWLSKLLIVYGVIYFFIMGLFPRLSNPGWSYVVIIMIVLATLSACRTLWESDMGTACASARNMRSVMRMRYALRWYWTISITYVGVYTLLNINQSTDWEYARISLMPQMLETALYVLSLLLAGWISMKKYQVEYIQAPVAVVAGLNLLLYCMTALGII